MSIRIDGREQIADQLEEAAAIIDRHGLATGALIQPHPGHFRKIVIGDYSPVTVSPLGALVLVNCPTDIIGDYVLPGGWDTEPDGLWAQRHLAVPVFAQYLVTTGRAAWGTDPGATITDWTRRPMRRDGWTGKPGPSKDEAVAVLEAASAAVRIGDAP